MSRGLADALNAWNLLQNGGFEFWSGVTTETPDGWTVGGATASALSSHNTFLVTDSEPVTSDEPTRKLSFALVNTIPVTASQSFGTNPGTFDFPVPCGTLPTDTAFRFHIPEGYKSTERTLVAHHAVSFSFAIRVSTGVVRVEAVTTEKPGDLGSATRTVGLATPIGRGDWRRVTLVFASRPTIYTAIALRLTQSGADRADVAVGGFQLSVGAYDYLPYTGNPTAEVWPQGAIIMVMGGACPTGFVEFDTSKAGKFPRGAAAIGADGGAATHNHTGTAFALPPATLSPSLNTAAGATAEFWTKLEPGNNDGFDVNVDRYEEHDHAFADAGSIPVSRVMKLCQRR